MSVGLLLLYTAVRLIIIDWFRDRPPQDVRRVDDHWETIASQSLTTRYNTARHYDHRRSTATASWLSDVLGYWRRSTEGDSLGTYQQFHIGLRLFRPITKTVQIKKWEKWFWLRKCFSSHNVLWPDATFHSEKASRRRPSLIFFRQLMPLLLLLHPSRRISAARKKRTLRPGSAS